MNSEEAVRLLKMIEWEDGKVVPLLEGPYRHRIVVHCSVDGRQEAQFANGNGRYFGYIELVAANGQWIEKGTGVVPILPDGRFIMVVEQRPAQARYIDRPMIARIEGRDIDLNKFGRYSSLEFPGGAVDPNEGLRAGFLRELKEETGVKNQNALFYSRCYPFYAFGSDVSLRQFVGVAFLSGVYYEKHTESDGGLNVLALAEEDVIYNIRRGVIHSAQAALLQWSFYADVKEARSDPSLEQKLKTMGYLSVSKIKIGC